MSLPDKIGYRIQGGRTTLFFPTLAKAKAYVREWLGRTVVFYPDDKDEVSLLFRLKKNPIWRTEGLIVQVKLCPTCSHAIGTRSNFTGTWREDLTGYMQQRCKAGI